MTTCADREAKQALRAIFEGELEPEAHARLRAHLAGCAECRELYDRLGRVESALEKRALPASREALLEKALFARLGEAAKPAPAKAPERRRAFRPRLAVPAAVGLVAAAAVLLWVVRPAQHDSEWQSRGGGTGTTAWGVRAFCVGPDGAVKGEARSGGTLVCGEGNTVQFSYTAPEAARLAIEGTSREGEPLRFFPREGAGDVGAGVDVVLPYSTPVQPSWLSVPLEVRVSFVDVRSRVLSQTRLTISPR